MSEKSAETAAAKVMRLRKAKPERIRLSLFDRSAGTPLPLANQRLWPAGIVIGVFFVIFAGIAWSQIDSMRGHKITTVFDLSFVLFQGAWVLGWSVGVFILGALTVLFLFYSESARLHNGRLIHMPRFGPLRINIEYDLAKIRNLRLASEKENTVQIRFDYGNGSNALGNAMPRPEAEKLVQLIRAAISSIPSTVTGQATAPCAEPLESGATEADRDPVLAAPPASINSLSSLSLIAVNLLPLVGVMLFGWKLGNLMVLYWAESAVIGLWNSVKLAVVGKWAAFFVVPFFVGHFGGFMAGHFMFVYYLFVRDPGAAGPEPGVWQALFELFTPLQSSIFSLFVSHGVSFFTNFIGRREYLGAKLKQQMAEPYKRIVVMHVTVIAGGFLTLALRTPEAALLLLIMLKTGADLRAHLREHGGKGGATGGSESDANLARTI
ncbi:MAG: DUF6498-containing protein [Candidatus Binatia bacterium]